MNIMLDKEGIEPSVVLLLHTLSKLTDFLNFYKLQGILRLIYYFFTYVVKPK